MRSPRSRSYDYVMPAGRFAPTPSGPLHVGGLRTALIAWLFARATSSRFSIRIEDLDPKTSQPQHARRQLDDLAALGLDWEEPVLYQSVSRRSHDAALAKLRALGLIYPCYCSRREIRDASTAPHVASGRYPGTCRDLSRAKAAQREASGRAPALRLATSGEELTIVDRLRGIVRQPITDIVLRRNDGVPAYNLAVVVDDDDQGVEEVVRADDLLEVTPVQAHLLDLLGRPRPTWAHVPLVLGPDGARLAKRHGSVTLGDLAAQGVTPAQVRGRIATSLGLAELDEPVSMARLLQRFDPDQLPTEPWVLTEPWVSTTEAGETTKRTDG
ncbi:MAG TPA: tRNA glutamyl-Q(34) synthetase GluQRS [Acidimicrobiales bacterium]|nr:tRNA glutamyl-Q(34) synthetase GluQRS [Acidimicrobiales bacterium]